MIVDLRSDTVTRPTPEMYRAMAEAPLGDDVLGDEPTVAKLEQIAAEKLGKEAAVFVPSGTMGNQMALATHCERGDAVLIEEEAHMVYYEVGGPGILANVVTWTLVSDKGVMDPANVEAHVLKRSPLLGEHPQSGGWNDHPLGDDGRLSASGRSPRNADSSRWGSRFQRCGGFGCGRSGNRQARGQRQLLPQQGP
jgi:hypothetical protein